MLTCKEDEAQDVGRVREFPPDLPRVEIVWTSELSLIVRVVLISGVFQHGAILLDRGLQGGEDMMDCDDERERGHFGPNEPRQWIDVRYLALT